MGSRVPSADFLSLSLSLSGSESQKCVSLSLSGALEVVLVCALRFCAAREVDGGLVLFVAVDVLEVNHHVQRVREHQQEDQRRDQTHQDRGSEERLAVAGRRKLTGQNIKRLDL